MAITAAKLALAPTHYALLGMLTLGEGSGYDLRKRIAESIGYFWQESFGQIYPALKGLEKNGLVSSRTQKTSGKPERLVYRIAPPGREAVREWLRASPKPEVHRQELLLKLFFGSEITPETSLEQVREFHQRLNQQLAAYTGVAAALKRAHASNPGYPYWLLTLSFGRRRAEALRDWCEEAEQVLTSIQRKNRAK